MSKTSSEHHCPKCHGTTVIRVRRGLFQRLFLRRRRPYRCGTCWHQFLDVPTGEADAYFAPERKQQDVPGERAS